MIADARPLSESRPHDHADAVDRAVFLLLVVLMAVRALVSEQFERIELTFLAGMMSDTAASPVTTAWLDAALLTASVWALLRRPTRGAGWMWFWIGTALLFVGVVVSTLFAGDKRLALSAGMNLVVYALAGGALVQVMRAPWMSRLALALLLAGLAATASRCLTDRFVYYAETVAQWQTVKAELIEQGRDPNDPMVVNYERRLMSGETAGFQPHPNLTAALLAMWVLSAFAAGAGLLAEARTTRRNELIAGSAALAALGGVGLGAMSLTGSMGAMAALLAGLLVFWVFLLGRRFAPQSLRHGWWLIVLAYLGLIAGGAAYGLSRGTLPHPSLAFRWDYWQAAGAVYAEHPLTGIGRENFLDAFLQHRPPAATEEVRNPHNLWVSALVELGPLGLAGLAVLVLVALAAVWRMAVAPPPQRGKCPSTRYAIVCALGVLVLHFVLSGTATAGTTAAVRVSMAFLWAVEVALVWIIGFAVARRVLGDAATAHSGRYIVAGIFAALLTGLVQSLVSFALLTPAGLSVFVLLAAAGMRWWPVTSDTPVALSRKWLAPAGAVIVLSAYGVAVAMPTAATQRALDALHASLAQAPSLEQARHAARTWGQVAIDADPLDPRTPLQVAKVLGSLAPPEGGDDAVRVEILEDALAAAEVARRRNPQASATYRVIAHIYESLETSYLYLARPDDMIAALRHAADAWQQAVTRHPTDARLHAQAGEVEARLWRETRDELHAARARAHYERAMAINATRAEQEATRFTAEQLAEIARELEELPAE